MQSCEEARWRAIPRSGPLCFEFAAYESLNGVDAKDAYETSIRIRDTFMGRFFGSSLMPSLLGDWRGSSVPRVRGDKISQGSVPV